MQCQFSFYQMIVFIVYYILHVRKVDSPQLGFIRLSSHVNVIKHHSIQTACGPRVQLWNQKLKIIIVFTLKLIFQLNPQLLQAM